ncbi:hypothetical protein SKAU_G00143840 [Synaphobranchus kaupii]|uniref:Uncharacterized protein n=1 Tax=Synaphobranchus kaupii TaxID=118154 RepID=A0A9Q1J4I9_SYNKA|nr:hypothetical protein SKAU_G00143840 [Synaphobranchus kaupii]
MRWSLTCGSTSSASTPRLKRLNLRLGREWKRDYPRCEVTPRLNGSLQTRGGCDTAAKESRGGLQVEQQGNLKHIGPDLQVNTSERCTWDKVTLIGQAGVEGVCRKRTAQGSTTVLKQNINPQIMK